MEKKNGRQESTTFVQGLCEILVKNGNVSAEDAQAMVQSFKDSAQEQFDEFLLDEGLVDRKIFYVH